MKSIDEMNQSDELRQILRDYYNNTFEYAIDQLEKGDFASIIANPETKQRELDEPYLKKLQAHINTHYLPKQQVIEAIGELEPKPGFKGEAWAGHARQARNQVRRQIKKQLGVE